MFLWPCCVYPESLTLFRGCLGVHWKVDCHVFLLAIVFLFWIMVGLFICTTLSISSWSYAELCRCCAVFRSATLLYYLLWTLPSRFIMQRGYIGPATYMLSWFGCRKYNPQYLTCSLHIVTMCFIFILHFGSL